MHVCTSLPSFLVSYILPNRISLCGLLVFAFSLSACGPATPKGPAVYPVKGNVKVDGKPLANVNVQFIPVDPQKPAGAGKTNANGDYSIMNSDGRSGAVPGTYKVVLKVVTDGSSTQAAEMYSKSTGAPGSAPAQPTTPFPAEFSEAAKTPKEVTVEAKPNVFDLAL